MGLYREKQLTIEKFQTKTIKLREFSKKTVEFPEFIEKKNHNLIENSQERPLTIGDILDYQQFLKSNR